MYIVTKKGWLIDGGLNHQLNVKFVFSEEFNPAQIPPQ
jgi:hypothetical protein